MKGILIKDDMATLDKASRNGLVVHVSESRSEMGARAASDIAHEVRASLHKQPGERMIFAAAPSQSQIIADGRHLPPDTLAVMLRSKTVARAVLISDLVAITGLPPGQYETSVGGKVDLHPDEI